jgi:hypothetical protein
VSVRERTGCAHGIIPVHRFTRGQVLEEVCGAKRWNGGRFRLLSEHAMTANMQTFPCLYHTELGHIRFAKFLQHFVPFTMLKVSAVFGLWAALAFRNVAAWGEEGHMAVG